MHLIASGQPFSVHVAVQLLPHTELSGCTCCCPLFSPPGQMFTSSVPIASVLNIAVITCTHKLASSVASRDTTIRLVWYTKLQKGSPITIKKLSPFVSCT